MVLRFLTCPNWNWARTSFVVCCLHFGPVVVIQRVRPALSQPMDGCNTVLFFFWSPMKSCSAQKARA